jgi:Glycosyltransferase family 87
MSLKPLLREIFNPRRLCEGAAISVAIIMLTLMIDRFARMHGLLLPNGAPMFGDFVAFWSAGKLALQGKIALVHDRHALTAVQHAAVVGMRVMAPWNSPPTFLLICAVLALLPYPAAAIAFLLLGGSIFLFAAWKLLPDKRAMLFAVTLPALLYQIGTVQVGLFIAGISGLAIHWLDKRPRVAGALVALLAIKPHMAILWPVLLLISRRWTAFFSAAIATAAFVLLAGLVFGFDSYLRFVENLSASADLITKRQVAAQTFASLYGDLLGLHVPRTIATIAHGVSAVSALIMACWIFWRGDRIAQGAALFAATLLMSPYLFFYDFTLLSVSAALIGTPRNRFEFFAIICAWLSSLSVASGFYMTLPLCPAAAWLMMIVALRRVGSAAPVPALAPQL